jgi:riboflavin kinase/FMN adenylyltransferase
MEHKMQVHKQAQEFNPERGSVITIGTFDGVHLGHRTILKKVVDEARVRDLNAVLLTFFPHPRMVVQKQTDLKLLNTLDEKIQLLEALGVDHLVIQPFTKEFSRLTAVEYVRDLLVNQLQAKKIIIGYDHRFGRNRTANIDDLKEFGLVYDFEVEEISAQQKDAVAISSTKIRKALALGDVDTANTYLGGAYPLSGIVIKGQSLGHTLGYPTANFVVSESYKLSPKQGVYLSSAIIDGQHYFGVTNIGTNPTVGGVDPRIETHFLELNANLYDRPIQIKLLSRIRDQKIFPDLNALKSAIAADIQHATDLIAKFRNRVV